MPDIGSASFSPTDASNNSASPNGAPEGMAPSGVNDTIRAVMGGVKRWFNEVNFTGTSSGTNTVTLTYTVADAAYVPGMRYGFVVGGTNTGATTLNINLLGAKNIFDLYGNALVGGELTANAYAEVMYDGTQFRLLSTARYLGPTLIWKKALTGANIDFDPLPTGFARSELNIYDLSLDTDNKDLNLLAKVSSFQTSNYLGTTVTGDSSGTTASAAQDTAVLAKLATNLGNDTNEKLFARATLWDPDNTARVKRCDYQSSYMDSAGVRLVRSGFGTYTGGTGAVTGLRIIPASGNLATGTAVLVGWRFG